MEFDKVDVPALSPFEKHVEANATAANAKAVVSARYYNELGLEPHGLGIRLGDFSSGTPDCYLYLNVKQATWLHQQLARIFGL